MEVTYVRIGACFFLRYLEHTLVVLDCETMKAYVDSKNDLRRGRECKGNTHRVAETRDQSYTQLRPIQPRPPEGVHGIV